MSVTDRPRRRSRSSHERSERRTGQRLGPARRGPTRRDRALAGYRSAGGVARMNRTPRVAWPGDRHRHVHRWHRARPALRARGSVMDIRTTFETAGLAVTGDPPAVTVSVGSATVIVQVGEERAGLVLLRAAIAVPGRLDPEDLAAAALATPGDQRYLAQPGRLVGERRLVEPTAGRAARGSA